MPAQILDAYTTDERVSISPSQWSEDEAEATETFAAAPRADAADYGTALHLLLEWLPRLSADKRDATIARRVLQQAGMNGEQPWLQDALEEVVALIDSPLGAQLYHSDTRYEVPLRGQVRMGGVTRSVQGSVDCVSPQGNELWVIDYKTGTPPEPDAPLPASYAAQLEAYRQLLAPLHPDIAVRAALLWTRNRSLQWLAD